MQTYAVQSLVIQHNIMYFFNGFGYLYSDDILERMMDESTSSDSKTLVGHSGTVYSVSFSPDRQYLLSSAEDGTGV